MLSKLLKNDLKKNMRWMWILFVGAIGFAAITRGAKEIGESVAFFKMIAIFLEGLYYGLAVNLIVQPFLRNFLNFHKSFYSDESYLTHTLPVTKSQLISSKYLTALIELVSGFAALVLSLLIMYAGPGFLTTLKFIFSMLIVGDFSTLLVVMLVVILIVVEFLMFISIIDFSIVMGFKSKEKRILKSFLITAVCAFAAITVLAISMIIVLMINGVKLTTTSLVLSVTAFYSVIITAIVIYSAVSVLFYLLAKREFNKGVNVD